MTDTTTLRVADATLHYEVRGNGPLLALIGAPMGARFFAPVADLLAGDHTVLTSDPRGIGASPMDDPESDSSAEQRADDLARLIEHVGGGPAAVFGSSGGAVTALALAQARPDLVSTVIAHEPPILHVLEDRAEQLAAIEDMIATYAAGDRVGAWRKFLANAGVDGPPPPENPDERHWFLHEMRGTVQFRLDAEALRRTRVVIGLGADSTGQLLDRTAHAVAAVLGDKPVIFPGDHIGFVMNPPAFAPAIVQALRG